ncbi:GNAT family N-acetyltransferase [Massilia glaciei]|uniref:N-acetyltransferase n=1 Tax=Massilia glaciei TaxID=1524097 RepID=A0A2U2HGZ4_9BURK|nr:GNAT family N-acetyltransferase [Massilia glaciei]PWF44702.1 N-acetyltransferase [Massilia glaciei]
MSLPNYAIRAITRPELDSAMDWAGAEGWNPGLHDAASFYAADPDGFLVGLIDGVPIASIFAVKYGATFAFIGGYIVKPEWRGQGYGMALWKAAMETLKGGNVGLDGVVAQQDNYRQSGFKLAHRNMRFETVSSGPRVLAAGIMPLATLPFEQVRTYDQDFFADERTQFLRHWIGHSQGAALGMLRGTELLGYGMLRPCRQGYKIGPLFADTPEVADALLRALMGEAEANQPVYLDVPQKNPDALAMAAKHGMTVSFETARMYTGPKPDLSMPRLYGVTTFELG